MSFTRYAIASSVPATGSPVVFGASFIWDRPEPIVNRTATSAEELVFTEAGRFLV